MQLEEARPVVDDPGPPGRLVHFGQRNWLAVVAVALAVLQLLWRGVILLQGWFGEDDFLYQARASRLGLSWDLLFVNYNGQLLPGPLFLSWLAQAVAPLSWGFAVAVVLVLQLAAAWAFWRLLLTVFGRRWEVLLPFALYLASPLTLPAYAWWAAALSGLPMQIGLCLALNAHVRFLRDPHRRHALACAAWTSFALSSTSRGVLIPVAMLGLSLWLLPRTGRRTLRRVLVEQRATWLLQAGTLAVFAVLYGVAPRDEASSSAALPTTASSVARFFGNAFGQVLAPGLLGGPWRWLGLGSPSALAQPRVALTWTAGVVLLGVVALSTAARRRGAGMWGVLLVYVTLDLALVAVGRGNLLDGALALETHYVADAVPLAYLVLAFMLLPVAGEASPHRALAWSIAGSRRAPVLVGVTAALAVSAAWSSHSFSTERLPRADARRYVETATQSLRSAPADARVFDEQVPSRVMNNLFGSNSRQSLVFSPVLTGRERARLFAPFPENPLLLDDSGRLVPLQLRGTRTLPGPTTGCGFVVPDAVTDLPLASPVFDFDWVVRVGYLAPEAGRLRLSVGTGTAVIPLQRGLHQVFFRMRASGEHVRAQVLGSRPVCIDRVEIGQASTTPAAGG